MQKSVDDADGSIPERGKLVAQGQPRAAVGRVRRTIHASAAANLLEVVLSSKDTVVIKTALFSYLTHPFPLSSCCPADSEGK